MKTYDEDRVVRKPHRLSKRRNLAEFEPSGLSVVALHISTMPGTDTTTNCAVAAQHGLIDACMNAPVRRPLSAFQRELLELQRCDQKRV